MLFTERTTKTLIRFCTVLHVPLLFEIHVAVQAFLLLGSYDKQSEKHPKTQSNRYVCFINNTTFH